MFIGTVRQTASLLEIEPAFVRPGEKGRARLRFLKQPEYIRVGALFLLREGTSCKATGVVISVKPLPCLLSGEAAAASSATGPTLMLQESTIQA